MLSESRVLHSWGCVMTVSDLRCEHKIFVTTKRLLTLARKVSSSHVICICLAGRYVANQRGLSKMGRFVLSLSESVMSLMEPEV